MKAGLIMMVLALALVIGAVVVSVTLRSEPERVVAAGTGPADRTDTA
jgi:hypothetical protein